MTFDLDNYGDPQKCLVEFARAHPQATKEEAAEYAMLQFPDSPLTIALFLADWQSLQERSLDEKHLTLP
jgi:hypothetical protein